MDMPRFMWVTVASLVVLGKQCQVFFLLALYTPSRRDTNDTPGDELCLHHHLLYTTAGSGRAEGTVSSRVFERALAQGDSCITSTVKGDYETTASASDPLCLHVGEPQAAAYPRLLSQRTRQLNKITLCRGFFRVLRYT